VAYRLLVIRCSSSTPGILLHEPWRLEDTYQVDFADWDWSRPSSLTEAGADLIVPVAIDKAGTAVKVFEWLSGHPLTTPILAITLQQLALLISGEAHRLAQIAGAHTWPRSASAQTRGVAPRAGRSFVSGSYSTTGIILC